MSLLDLLQRHASLCDEIHALMLAENRLIRTSGRPPHDAFLADKRSKLAELTRSLEEVRAAQITRGPLTPELRAAIEKAQQTILKALLLDRENEQLLLKATMPARPAPVAVKPAVANVAKAYGKGS